MKDTEPKQKKGRKRKERIKEGLKSAIIFGGKLYAHKQNEMTKAVLYSFLSAPTPTSLLNLSQCLTIRELQRMADFRSATEAAATLQTKIRYVCITIR